MKKGDKVKCVDNLCNGYLTTGKVYDVVAGEGDRCAIFGDVLDDDEFNIICDDGDRIYVRFNSECHAVWEVVND